nr:unnamed protein product [Digitaria exilis]
MAAEEGQAGRRGAGAAAARRKAKEAAVGAAARVLFYPTLLYNVVRSKAQAEFRWWDEVDQVVQEFSKKNAELPAVTSDCAKASPASEAVPLTEANLDGNDAPVALTEAASLSGLKTSPSGPVIKMLSYL